MSQHTRRQFIKTATATAAASTLPQFAIGKPGASANSKLNIAVVGAAGMGGYAVGVAAKENMAALCDVDEARAAKNFKKYSDAPKFK